MAKSPIDPALLQFCTPRQKEILEAIIREGGQRKAAAALGVSQGTIGGHLKRVRRQASRRGYSPEHDNRNIVPETHYAKGVSTLYGADNEIKLQWVKSAADSEMIQAVAEQAAEAFFEARKPLPASRPPKSTDGDLLTVYAITDLHLGMYSWAQETGEDYDCDIAAGLLIGAMQRLIERTPASSECVIAQLGDLLHTDDDSNQTRRSGNPLDVDTRYHRVAGVGLKLYRAAIDLALQRHGKVRVINVPGNHDDLSTYWLGVAVKTAYEKDKRVDVDNSCGPYFYHRFGKNLLGFAHGHTCKMQELGEIMTADRPEDVGATKYRHWMTGHIHHQRSLEGRICTAESFRTLAAKDAWHHRAGYRSGRDMQAVVYHREWGEDERFRVGVREVQAAA